MPSGHFREYILHLTMALRWLHDIVKPSHTIRINIVCKTTTSCIVRDCIGYNRVSIVCPSVGFVHASAQHWRFTKFVTKIARNSKFHIRVSKSARSDASITNLIKSRRIHEAYRLSHDGHTNSSRLFPKHSRVVVISSFFLIVPFPDHCQLVPFPLYSFNSGPIIR